MGTRKVVINAVHGGFGLSEKAYQELGIPWDGYGHAGELQRDDSRLVDVVERLGKDANGAYASLRIVEIPDDVAWRIEEYDGAEWVAEGHRTWA